MKNLSKKEVKGEWLAQSPAIIKMYLNDTITMYSHNQQLNVRNREYDVVYNKDTKTYFISTDKEDLLIELWMLDGFPETMSIKINETKYEFKKSN
jgi:hypothetical protein